MSQLQLGQSAAAFLAVATPWIVARTAQSVAWRHAPAVREPFARPGIVASLGWLTAVVVPAAVIAALVIPPVPWMVAIDAAGFVSLGIVAVCAFRQIEEASHAARQVASEARVASLRPRDLRHYLAPASRALFFGLTAAGLALFIWRLATPDPGRRLLVPVVFALVAPVFSGSTKSGCRI